MEAGRRALPHETPLWVDVSRSVYFITCCVQDRGEKPFFRPETARGLLDSITHRIEKGEWWVYAATVMPDHVHLVLSFPEETVITNSLRNWKHWTSQAFEFQWQRDFFEHRLRSDESLQEKLDYVLQNSVRAGLVAEWRDWPFTLVAQSR
jgi:putative transposase